MDGNDIENQSTFTQKLDLSLNHYQNDNQMNNSYQIYILKGLFLKKMLSLMESTNYKKDKLLYEINAGVVIGINLNKKIGAPSQAELTITHLWYSHNSPSQISRERANQFRVNPFLFDKNDYIKNINYEDDVLVMITDYIICLMLLYNNKYFEAISYGMQTFYTNPKLKKYADHCMLLLQCHVMISALSNDENEIAITLYDRNKLLSFTTRFLNFISYCYYNNTGDLEKSIEILNRANGNPSSDADGLKILNLTYLHFMNDNIERGFHYLGRTIEMIRTRKVDPISIKEVISYNLICLRKSKKRFHYLLLASYFHALKKMAKSKKFQTLFLNKIAEDPLYVDFDKPDYIKNRYILSSIIQKEDKKNQVRKK